MNIFKNYSIPMYLVMFLLLILILSCRPVGKKQASLQDINALPVNPAFFIQESLAEAITKEKVKSPWGDDILCYKITVHPEPSEHEMGPWCPEHIDDGKEKGGIWFEKGNVYDVDGHFIANLDEFYADPKWEMFREDGSVKVTDTQEACEAAARPDVDPQYKNHCVECLPAYYKEKKLSYLIPLTPQYMERPVELRRDGIGLAFNGVKFEGPAPTHAILAAHTLAPLDDHGGHVNAHVGYHYHAATGSSKEVEQSDDHAPMIGYALDGFGIFARLDKAGKEPEGLDECGGHIDEQRGYHYHAGKPGTNQIIGCLHGVPGKFEGDR